MKDLKKLAIEIAGRHPFTPFLSSASAANGQAEAGRSFAACDNHLDVNFMNLLDQGAHLDVSRMPL